MAKPRAQDVLAVARGLADEVLFPDAMRVDRLDVLPVAHLDALAATGLYGAPVPADAGGLGLDLPEVAGVAPWPRSVMIVPVLSPPGGRNRHQADS